MRLWTKMTNEDLLFYDDNDNQIIQIYKMVQSKDDKFQVVWKVQLFYDNWSYTEIVEEEEFNEKEVKGFAEWLHEHAGRIIPLAFKANSYGY